MDGCGSGANKMEQAKQYAVEIDGLTRKVKKKQIIQPIDYQLESGNILALCGGNGAGKSTLIRLIIGLIKPTAGEVRVFGKTRKEHKGEFYKLFSYMPDDFQFQKMMTAKETMNFYAKIKGIPRSRWEKTLEDVGLSNRLNEKVGTFSKGMNQRLLLAQTLMADSKILILDEPTNGLDPYWIHQFAQLMLRAKENGQTVIFSTHDLHVAEQIADDVVFLKDGKVISQGPIENYLPTGLHQAFQTIYFEEKWDKGSERMSQLRPSGTRV